MLFVLGAALHWIQFVDKEAVRIQVPGNQRDFTFVCRQA